MKHLYRNISCKTFPGFCESLLYHSDTLYHCDTKDGYELDFVKGGFEKYCNNISEEWVDLMSECTENKIDIKSMKFKELDSPKFYNFTTDKLYIEIEFNLTKLKEYCFKTNSDDFNDFLHKNFTSRDGFISFVPNSLHKFLQDYNEDINKDVLIDVMLEYYFLNECDLEDVLYRVMDCQWESIYPYLCLYKRDDCTNWDMEWDNDENKYVPTKQRISEKIIEFVKDYYKWSLQDNGYTIERYVDYNEKFPQSDIEKILSSENPQETFCEIVTEWDCRSDDWYYEELFWNDFRAFCKENNFDEDEARDVVYGNFYWTYPSDFLNPMVNTVWTINTGDLNYDFSCHNVLNYCGNGVLEEPAGLYWLAKQQGRLSLLKKEIKKSDRYHDGECEQSKFVESCITELVNVTSMLTHLTFLVKMPLLDAIKIIEAYNEAEKLGKFKYLYPQGIKEDIGYVILSKDTLCGLYDSINGGGSMLEIELEKDVKIPLQYIWRIETNKDIQGCYGMTESCWKETVKKIDIKELL